MTLKELIGKVDFESLVPFIEKTEEKHLDSIYEYREAYDILRNMKPSENFKGEATVGWSGKGYGDKQWIGVFHLDGDDWEDALAKEIVIGKNVNLPIEEIAAKCLWEITYYGFTPEHEGFECILGRKIRDIRFLADTVDMTSDLLQVRTFMGKFHYLWQDVFQ